MRTEVSQQLVHHSDDDRNSQFAPRGFIVYGRHHRFFASLSHTTWQLALALTNYQIIAICIMRRGRRLNFKTGFRFALLLCAPFNAVEIN
ncbi:hypothetical protein CEXT_555971 [Caerostris extrusa]|uniref:Uncharacterized protein n=1 Tax=Caerostris extrusa TaxID=172846 RepID=A0AAV4TFF1_CAEEX|nr:hypothetical protein CEXT_555971 [Caerostris extrusa]